MKHQKHCVCTSGLELAQSLVAFSYLVSMFVLKRKRKTFTLTDLI